MANGRPCFWEQFRNDRKRDPFGRALISLTIRPTPSGDSRDLLAWIDTGFNGDLVLPKRIIDDLQFPHAGTTKAILADGSQVALNVYTCLIDWFDEERVLEVVANDGEFPLLGIGLLVDHDLHISYRGGNIEIDSRPV